MTPICILPQGGQWEALMHVQGVQTQGSHAEAELDELLSLLLE